MDDPRTYPLPDAPLQRAAALARELAYGVVVGDWGVTFRVTYFAGGVAEWYIAEQPHQIEKFDAYLSERWGGSLPSPELLEVLGYWAERPDDGSSGTDAYVLSSKAFDLLNAPPALPSVFIAYSRRQSSALALLVEARLAAVGVRSFLDRLIEGGAEWEDLIRTTITQRITHLVCLIGPGTLASPHVCNEIRWALSAGKITIPIWHGGFSPSAEDLRALDPDIREFLEKKNAIRVLEESAASYDTALSQLLNQLEFAVAPTPVHLLSAD